MGAPISAASQGDVSTGAWVRPNETIVIELPPEQKHAANELRVFLGTLDVTVLARVDDSGRLTVNPAMLRWPSGTTELVVHRVASDEWHEVARVPLQVLTPAGFERASGKPRVDLKLKSQPAQGYGGDAQPALRTDYTDLAGQGGLSWEVTRGAFRQGGQVNFVGSSFREEALRFGQLAHAAPKVDLSDYRLDTQLARMNVSFGHVSYGNHPLLLQQMNSRGGTLGYRMNDRLDVSLNAMNGTSIVGYDDLLGFEDADHRVTGATVGYEVVSSRPGALRVEATYLDASLQNRTNFNVGEIPDAETSRGWGLRLIGQSAGGRVRGDLSWARSTYVNPFDPVLAQNGPLQEVQRTTGAGRTADISFDVVRGSTLLSESHPLTVTLTAHHERIDPLYNTIGAFLSADQQHNRAGLSAQLAGSVLQLQWGRQEDNLEDIPTLLKTETHTAGANLSLPLAQWWQEDAAHAVWPQVTYSWQRVRQQAGNLPLLESSGFASSQLPRQVNDQHQLNASWVRSSWSLSYAASLGMQDNRQPGREIADLQNLVHQLTVGLNPGGGLAVNVGLGRARNYSREQRLANYSNTAGIDVVWQPSDAWTIAANVALTRSDDSLDLATSDSDNVHVQVNRQLAIPAGGRKVPAQVFIRYARQESASTDSVFGFATQAQTWTVDAGFSMGLF